MQPLASRTAEPMREGLGHSLNFPASPSLAFTLAELTKQPRQAWSGSHQRGLGSAASLMSVHGSTPARTPTLSAVTGPLAGRAVWPPAGRASHKRRVGSHRRNVMWRSTRDPQWVTGEDEAFFKGSRCRRRLKAHTRRQKPQMPSSFQQLSEQGA